MQRFDISGHWTLKQRNPAAALEDDFATDHQDPQWLPAQVPGTVHTDLMTAGKIPDPFLGLNELDVQWVGEADWLYRCTFEIPPEALAQPQIDLCFDGLDTIATVWLNGQQILVSDNMFVPARVPIKHLVLPGANSLHILFESALRHGQALEARYGKMAAWNGDPSRVYVRKAQYHYGWDWGPTLLTAGPWKPIRVEAYAARIADIAAPAQVSEDLASAVLPVTVALEGSTAEIRTVQITLIGPDGAIVGEATVKADQGQSTIEHSFDIVQPALWYPRGYGEQPRYRLIVTLTGEGGELDRREMAFGVRRLRLVQEPLQTEDGTSFYFEINNVPVFAGGANWIPADNFLTRLDADQYHAWLTLAAEGNQIMLRVWGGGIYEHDAFYETCDELGLLVWQDFLFGCGIYPAYPEFQASVRAEAEAALRRLRHHASIVLWCGNNEDYQIAQSINAYDASFQGDSADFTTTRFPARAIYERLLPEVCARLDPTRPYWPGSPYGGSDVYDRTVGDRHTWEVWHGNMAPYNDYHRFSGRFVSEFGMQAVPDLATIESFAAPEDRHPHSRVLEHHNKATDGPRRLAWYLSDFAPAEQLDAFIYQTQFLQAEAVSAGIDLWRRRWAVPGNRLTAGALVWQINDCWPVTSWALVDSLLRPKPAYYRLKRSLAPLSLGTAREGSQVALWAVNGTLSAINAVLDIQIWRLNGTGSPRHAEQRTVSLAANSVTELGSVPVQLAPDDIASVRLLNEAGDLVLARAARWPDPAKFYDYADAGLTLERVGSSTGTSVNQFRLNVARPARGLVLRAEAKTNGAPVRWSDNTLDLFPGDPQTVKIIGVSELVEHIEYAFIRGQLPAQWHTATVTPE